MTDEKRKDAMGSPALGRRGMDKVVNLENDIQEFKTEISRSIEQLGEKMSALNARQDTADKVNAELLAVVRETGRHNKARQAQSDTMAQDIKNLSKVFGDIKVELANIPLASHAIVETKLVDVYDKVNDNRKVISDFKTEIARDYLSIPRLNLLLGGASALIGLILFMAWTTFDDHKLSSEKALEAHNKVDLERHSTWQNSNRVLEEQQTATLRRIEESINNHTLNSKTDGH